MTIIFLAYYSIKDFIFILIAIINIYTIFVKKQISILKIVKKLFVKVYKLIQYKNLI